jgi:hypothetical protein
MPQKIMAMSCPQIPRTNAFSRHLRWELQLPSGLEHSVTPQRWRSAPTTKELKSRDCLPLIRLQGKFSPGAMEGRAMHHVLAAKRHMKRRVKPPAVAQGQ